MARSRPHLGRILRDTAIFVAGLAGFIHEGFFATGAERPVFLGATLVLMGIPSTLQLGDKLWRATTNQTTRGYYRKPEDEDDEWERRVERLYDRLESGQRRPPRHRPPAN